MNEKEAAPEKSSLTMALIGAVGSILLGLFIHLCLTQSTAEFLKFGMVWAVLLMGALALWAVPFTFVLCWVAALLNRRNLLPKWVGARSIVVAGLLGMLALIVHAFFSITSKARYAQLVGVADEHASGIRVTGFNSFLARRWFLEFRIAPEHAGRIVSELGLEEVGPIDLQSRLKGDALWKSTSPAVLDAPGRDGTRCYRKVYSGDEPAEWITFVFRESDQRAWFYSGYQN